MKHDSSLKLYIATSHLNYYHGKDKSFSIKEKELSKKSLEQIFLLKWEDKRKANMLNIISFRKKLF